MKTKRETTHHGFIAAGLMNIIGVLVFSEYSVILSFRNDLKPCQILVNDCSLGFAYIAAVAKQFYQLKWLIAVFTIEKLIYATHWTNWILNNKITDVMRKIQ
jgi:hypothetical protein